MAEKNKFKTVEELRVSWSSAVLFIFFVFFFFNFWQLVHERFFVSIVKDSMGRSVVADYNIEMIAWVLGGLLLLTLVFGIIFRKQFWRFLTSMQLGITLMFAVTAGTVLGTLVFQNATAQDYTSFYGEFFYFIFTRLNLVNVFDAWWFLAFEVLLAVSLISVTIRTKPWTLGRLGAMLIHVGIVATIFGAFFGVATQQDGMMFIGEGDETNYAVRDDFIGKFRDMPEYLSKLREYPDIRTEYDLMKPEHLDLIPEEFLIDLGGTVKLDEFEEIYYEEPYIVSLWRQIVRQDMRTMQAQTVTRARMQIEFTDTKPLPMDEGLGKLQIVRTFKNFRRSEKIVGREDGHILARLNVDLKDSDSDYSVILDPDTFDKPMRGTAYSVQPYVEGLSQLMSSSNAYNLRFVWEMPEESALQPILETTKEGRFVIMVRSMTSESADHEQTNFRIGESRKLGSTDFTAKVVKFYPNLLQELDENGELQYSNASEELLNPAIEVEITGGQYTEPLNVVILANGQPHESSNWRKFLADNRTILGFILAPTSELILVGETKELLVCRDGQIVETIDMASQSYHPQYTNVELSLDGVSESGLIEVEYFDDNPETQYAVEVKVTKDGEERTQVLELLDDFVTAQQRDADPERYFMYLDEKNFIALTIRGDYIKDWRAHVTVSENGGNPFTHTIRVNEPLVLNGFYFYQSDWQPKVPYGMTPEEYTPDDPAEFSADKWYTYLRVTKDPGLPFVYLGIFMCTIGIFWAFYIGPRFRKGSTGNESAREEK